MLQKSYFEFGNESGSNKSWLPFAMLRNGQNNADTVSKEGIEISISMS